MARLICVLAREMGHACGTLYADVRLLGIADDGVRYIFELSKDYLSFNNKASHSVGPLPGSQYVGAPRGTLHGGSFHEGHSTGRGRRSFFILTCAHY